MTRGWAPVEFYGTNGAAPIVLVCEHASPLIPDEFTDLGIAASERRSHAIWDIGALSVAKGLSAALGAPLAACGVSRALYDCNRPPNVPDSIPSKSEAIAIPGNENLGTAERAARCSLIHDPFHGAVARLIHVQREKLQVPVAVVTIHSFTPVFHGQRRDVEIGFLHHGNPSLSKAALATEEARGKYRCALNQPYDARDGVTYTLRKHADANQLHSTMVEIRNDMIDTDDTARDMAAHLADTLRDAVAQALQTEVTA